MQFEDPKSMLEASAAKPVRGVDPHTLIKRGRRLRRARYAAVAAGLAVSVAGASASFGLLGTDRPAVRPAGVVTGCDEEPASVTFLVRHGATRAEIKQLRVQVRRSPGVTDVAHESKVETNGAFRRAYADRPHLITDIAFDSLPATVTAATASPAAARRLARLESPAIAEAVRGVRADGPRCLVHVLCAQPPALEMVMLFGRDVPQAEREALRDLLDERPDVAAVEYLEGRPAYDAFTRIFEDRPELWETVGAKARRGSLRVEAVDEAAALRLMSFTAPELVGVVSGIGFRERFCSLAGVTPGPAVTQTAAPAASNPVAEVTLLRQECGTTLPGLGRARFPDGDPATWCLFALRIDNQGEVPVVLDPARQRLASKIATRRPWETTDLGNRLFDPIPPGESRLGQLVFLLNDRDAPVALELEIVGISRPIQFGVDGGCLAEVARGDSSVCAVEHEFPTSYLIRGYTLEGTAEVELYHCGVSPIAFDKRSWIADPPPFDATNAPEEFMGRGRMITELGSLSATYVDESGVSFELEAVEDWEQPPCN